MKISIKEVLETKNAFDKILNIPLDVKLSYRMKKISAKLMAELKHVDEVQKELYVKYGEKQEGGGLSIPAAKQEEFQAAWKELLNTETEFDAQKIPFACLERVSLSANDLAILDRFIEEPTDAELGNNVIPMPTTPPPTVN